MPDLSGEERIHRQRAVDFARGSVQLSGGGVDSEVEALNARYVGGELSDDEHVAAVIAYARTYPSPPSAGDAAMTALPKARSRPWQLLMVGPGSNHITPDLHDQLVQLLDLLPQTRLIEIDTEAGGVSVSRDWPSDRMENVSGIEADIAALPGIRRLTLFQAV